MKRILDEHIFDAAWVRLVLMFSALVLAPASVFCASTVKVESPAPMDAQRVSSSAWFVQGVAGLGSPANQNFISNAGFVVTQDSVVVFDALGSPAAAERLVEVIRSITPLPIKHVFVSHYHADHIYGLQVFKRLGARVYAGREAMSYLQSDRAKLRLQASRESMAPWINADTELISPDDLLEKTVEFVIGGLSFQLRAVGPAHTPEDFALYLPREKVLFSGDLVFRNRVPFVGDADSRRWVSALDDLLSLEIEVIVPGHGPASREPARDMRLTRDYLMFLREAMGRAAAVMEPFDSAYQNTDWSAFRNLPLFEAANRMNAYNTYLLLEQEASK